MKKEKYKNKLWCDLKTIDEKIEFIICGRAWETGMIAKEIEKDIIKLYTKLKEEINNEK